MTFSYKNYQIKSYEGGYMVQKRAGRQWRVIGYYSDLRDAVADLFQHRILIETADCIVDATNKDSIRLQSAQIIIEIQRIADEILEGLAYGRE